MTLLVLRNIVNANDMPKERLIMKATEDLDVGDYAVLQVGTTNDGQLGTLTRNSFWFPYKKIKKNDLVVLYTKDGDSSEKPTESGSTAHFYYWGLSSVIWTDAKLHAVLLHAPSWVSKTLSELTR